MSDNALDILVTFGICILVISVEAGEVKLTSYINSFNSIVI